MTNFHLLSISFNEYYTKMQQAYEAGDKDQTLYYAQQAAKIANQIIYAPGARPETVSLYKNEFDKITRFAEQLMGMRPEPGRSGNGGGNGSAGSSAEEKKQDLPPVTEATDMSYEEAHQKLEELIGLSGAKQEVNTMFNLVRTMRRRAELGLKTTNVTMHMVFYGKPGTGKTTVARLIAQMYKALGILSKGHLVEVKRADLVAEYEGQTAIKTKKVVQSALGGVLFIDEAYTLIREEGNDPFGNEAVDTLLTFLEDAREDFLVIAAGYPEPMQTFLDANEGLRSRFKNFITFEDYSEEELYRIFEMQCKKKEYTLSGEARDALLQLIDTIYRNRGDGFANARTMRNLLEDMIRQQSNRISSPEYASRLLTREDLSTFEVDDVPKDYMKYTGKPL